jgi:hypothetical protein
MAFPHNRQIPMLPTQLKLNFQVRCLLLSSHSDAFARLPARPASRVHFNLFVRLSIRKLVSGSGGLSDISLYYSEIRPTGNPLSFHVDLFAQQILGIILYVPIDIRL